MTGALRRLRGDERGIALMVALAALLALGIAVTAVITYTTSNQQATHLSQAEQSADQVAESGMQQAYSILQYQAKTGGDPTKASLLSCDPSSGCTSSNALTNSLCMPISGTCSGTSHVAGTARVYGVYGGTNGTTFNSVSVPVKTWEIWATGYAASSGGSGLISHALRAEVAVNSTSRGLQSSVWNYLFSSAPAGSGCELDVNGNNVTIDVPIFVTGDLCFSGNNAGVAETKQKVDVQVLGKTVFSGPNTYVGSSTTPITSGVSVGGCATSINNTGASCSSYAWHVKTTDTAPSPTPTAPTPDFATAYSTAGIGPTYGCATSGTLAKATFDNDTTRNNSVSTFNLTPSSSYTCVSTVNGTTSTLSWDNTKKQLTVSGTIYIDGSAQVSQAAYYTGSANLYLSGTFSFSGQNSGLCATGSTTCNFTNGAWNTSNNMLLILPADMAGSLKAAALDGNNNFLQAGILAPSSATISLGGNNVQYQGPIIGGKYTWGNNVSLAPLPPITTMPPGAPVDPNVSVSVGGLNYTG